MAADSLCVGDFVCIYSEEAYGYCYSTQSSSVFSELAVMSKQNRDRPIIPDPQVICFELCTSNRYKLTKKYRKLKEKSDIHPDDVSLITKASQAKISADVEAEDNISEQKRQRGKKLLYGQIVQLRHVFTSKYVTVSTTQTSRTESSNMQVKLDEHNSKHCQFRIMPRYKVKSEGDIVQVEDQVVLESVKSAGQYLHASQPLFGSQSVYAGSHELNLSVRQSGFTVYRSYKPEKEHTNMLKAGEPVRLFHKEIEAYMVAEGLFDEDMMEDVHLRLRPMDPANPKTLFPSSSAITYWQIEMDSGPQHCGVLRWEQQCRFRHMTTRMYLKADGAKISMTRDENDPKTYFRIHPVIKEKDQIEYETYCRIENVIQKTWLHAMPEEYQRQQNKGQSKTDTSMASLQWTTASLRKLSGSNEMQYDDAFTIQRVEEDLVDIFNYMAGMVPFLNKLIKDKKSGLALKAKATSDTLVALKDMKTFMIVNSVPKKKKVPTATLR